MRIVTWNVNSLKARIDRVEAWIQAVGPDVLCLQETNMADPAFPHERFEALGYESTHHGEGQWNGVAVISRVGLDEVRPGFDDGNGPVYTRYAQPNDDYMDEAHFPILWRQDGYRTAGLPEPVGDHFVV